MNSYNEEHVEFLSHNKGSDMSTISLMLVQGPLLALLCTLAMNLVASSSLMATKKWKFVIEFVIVVLSQLLSMTVGAHPRILNISTLCILLGILRMFSFEYEKGKSLSSSETQVGGLPNYVINFKGMTVLLSCLAILAVDFPVFPRYFSKTETFGISLMDLGSGSFIVSSAIASKYARGKVSTVKDEAGITLKFSFLSPNRLAVLALGFGRLIALPLVDYHEQVTEYGVHWNFFMTLYCVWFVADLVHTFVPREKVLCIAVGMLIVSQYCLLYDNGKLTQFVFSVERDGSIFGDNREGIVSIPGYSALFLLAESLAHYSMYAPSSQWKLGNTKRLVLLRLFVVCLGVCIAYFSCSTYLQPVSRRLANPGYVCFVLLQSFLTLSAFYLAQEIVLCMVGGKGVGPNALYGLFNIGDNVRPASPLYGLECLSRWSLSVFLAANALTGLVNLNVETIRQSMGVSLALLTAHAGAVVGVAWLLDTCKGPINDKL